MVWFVACLVVAWQAEGPHSAVEREASLARVRATLADDLRPLDQRASLALDEAASLDRAAQSAATENERRSRSAQAVALLDDFNAAHPRHALSTALALQAAVFAWANARRDLDAWRIKPADASLKDRAARGLESSLARLERLEPDLSGADPLVAQNARFRQAQALADRASLDPVGSTAEVERLRKVLATLDPVPNEPSIAGYARLLRAEANTRLGTLDVAEAELDRAVKAKYPPPPEALIEAMTTISLGQRRWGDALRAIDVSPLDPAARAALAVRVLLDQRKSLPSGQERREVEATLFNRAKGLRGTSRADARLALNALARDVDAPTAGDDLDAWEILIDATLGLGESARAAGLASRGADRAEARGRGDDAGRLRFKAGAILFQMGDFSGADSVLGLVLADPRAGASRPKAGMLRAIARGRAVEARTPSGDRAAYLQALRDQVRNFPDDPVTGEARWLLGSLEAEEGRTTEAVTHWTSIAPSHPRWLASRLALASEYQRRLDEATIVGDSATILGAYRAAVAFLRRSESEAPDPVELELAAIVLDLTPGVARPDQARAVCDRIAHQGAPESLHARARMLRIVALAMSQRYLDAEKEALAEAGRASDDDLFLATRLLDRAATETESDVQRSRLGRVVRILTDALTPRIETMAPARASEARLRTIRAQVFVGQAVSARRSLSGPSSPDPDTLDIDLLRDLADTLDRLEAYGLAVDIERLRSRRLRVGTPAWFQARYGLALASYRSRKPADARKIIDATAILHPELGGGRLREKFERLRQRLDQD